MIVWEIITEMGGIYFFLLVVGIYHWIGDRRRAVGLAVLLFLESFIVGGLKEFFHAPRPAGATENSYAYPSGHASKSAALVSFLMGKRVYLLVIPILVAVSRVQLGEHYWADVATGLVLGAAVGLLFGKVWQKAPGSIERNYRLLLFALLSVLSMVGLYLAFGFPYTNYIGSLLGLATGFLLNEKTSPKPFMKSGRRILWGMVGFGALAYAMLGTTGPLNYGLNYLLGLWISFFSVRIINEEAKFSEI